jgi:D-glycero-D-manno-heptose 1,7-bisphosphate phosphatase
MNVAVFLDRDGTLNRCFQGEVTSHPPASVAELALVDGASEACARLREAGYLLLVVTNQPDVRRGSQSQARVEEINDRLAELLQLDDVASCYHDDRDSCACRKPKAGLILDSARRHDVDLARSFMVGDRWSDIAAGKAAGCRTVLVSATAADCGQDYRRDSLAAATELVVSMTAVSMTTRPSRQHQGVTT